MSNMTLYRLPPRTVGDELVLLGIDTILKVKLMIPQHVLCSLFRKVLRPLSLIFSFAFLSVLCTLLHRYQKAAIRKNN